MFSSLFLMANLSKCSAAITPVFSVTWSFRKHWCSGNISYYYQCWKQFLCLSLLINLFSF